MKNKKITYHLSYGNMKTIARSGWELDDYMQDAIRMKFKMEDIKISVVITQVKTKNKWS